MPRVGRPTHDFIGALLSAVININGYPWQCCSCSDVANSRGSSAADPRHDGQKSVFEKTAIRCGKKEILLAGVSLISSILMFRILKPKNPNYNNATNATFGQVKVRNAWYHKKSLIQHLFERKYTIQRRWRQCSHGNVKGLGDARVNDKEWECSSNLRDLNQSQRGEKTRTRKDWMGKTKTEKARKSETERQKRQRQCTLLMGLALDSNWIIWISDARGHLTTIWEMRDHCRRLAAVAFPHVPGKLLRRRPVGLHFRLTQNDVQEIFSGGRGIFSLFFSFAPPNVLKPTQENDIHMQREAEGYTTQLELSLAHTRNIISVTEQCATIRKHHESRLFLKLIHDPNQDPDTSAVHVARSARDTLVAEEEVAVSKLREAQLLVSKLQASVEIARLQIRDANCQLGTLLNYLHVNNKPIPDVQETLVNGVPCPIPPHVLAPEFHTDIYLPTECLVGKNLLDQWEDRAWSDIERDRGSPEMGISDYRSMTQSTI
ncbi:hypothetical protein GALMADRAFT_217668 [Galerina marginata CBS 339.88]|uniref:Uncharacterized protein n=1 Tax=Galerina marginata (strain CBS 339.88) TaxID=685588 RepID=A0A067S2X0_GALM3|nr:hypothetical protein GALMADRAFT_217668 [Galerina marginata CBS 339.88]